MSESNLPQGQITMGYAMAFGAWFQHRVWAHRFNGICGGWACRDCRDAWWRRQEKRS